MTALPAPPDEQVRALAVAILKRSEFAFWHDTPWLISFLAWLSGLWETDPNGTLRRRLRDAGLPEAERGDLLALIDWLEQRWFRDRNEERELYDRWRSLHARLGAVLKPA